MHKPTRTLLLLIVITQYIMAATMAPITFSLNCFFFNILIIHDPETLFLELLLCHLYLYYLLAIGINSLLYKVLDIVILCIYNLDSYQRLLERICVLHQVRRHLLFVIFYNYNNKLYYRLCVLCIFI